MRSRLCQFAGPYGKQVCTRPGEETTDYKACNLQACTGALGEYGLLEKGDTLMFSRLILRWENTAAHCSQECHRFFFMYVTLWARPGICFADFSVFEGIFSYFPGG